MFLKEEKIYYLIKRSSKTRLKFLVYKMKSCLLLAHIVTYPISDGETVD